MSQYAHLYNTRRWRRRRDHQLAIEPLCRYCKAMGRTTPATIADHIEPHRGDPELFWCGELQSLCSPCHSSVKQAEEHRGYMVGAGEDGLPVDPQHPWNRG